MFTVYFGTDTVLTREKAHSHIAECVEEGAEPRIIERSQFVPGSLREYLGSDSLFGERYVYLFDTPSEDADWYEEVILFSKELALSPTTFIAIEGALTAPERRKFTAAECVECKKGGEERFNVFSLTDLLIAQDKKNLWIRYHDARAAGIVAEEILGTLFWQVKSIILAGKCGSPEEAGLKPFVYQKAKRAYQKYSNQEVAKLAEDLVSIYHDGHSGKTDINTALEHWILSI